MEIESCSSLEEIFGKEEEEEEDHQENEIVSLKIDHTARSATSQCLGNLVFIKISRCHELKNLFTPSIAKLIRLCNLKLVSVYRCSNLRQVFPPAILQSLVSLENMEIDYCDSLEEIFGKEKEEDHQENELVSLKIDRTATSPRLGNLVFIKISRCSKLKSLFTPSIAKGLVQLRTLKVELCRTLEEIISDEKAETGGSTDRITFPGLYQIDLRGLDSLTCFCARRCTIEFPALELLDIYSCPKMETFGRGDQVTPKLVNMINLEGKKRWMDNLNITLQQAFKERSQDSDSDSGDIPEITLFWSKR